MIDNIFCENVFIIIKFNTQ